MSDQSISNAVVLPPGVTVAVGRETSQSNASGQIVQGVNFILTLPQGGTTTVFIPYALMSYTTQVEQLFAQRVAQIQAVAALGN